MSEAREARQSELDRVLDSQHTSGELAEELFAIADTLAGQPSLRRALTDPSMDDGARSQVVAALFGAKVSDAAVHVLSEAARLRWGSSGAFTAAVERQGVRAALEAAQRDGQLDEVEDQLFRLGRIVDTDRELRAVLANRSVEVGHRQELLASLLAGKVLPTTTALARRAVVARNRTFDLTLAEYLTIAALLRRRAIATVRVARPLTSEQEERMRNALSRQVGREVTLHVVVDPSVIGGVRVSVGDEVIEGTIASRLTDAHRALS